MNCRSNPLGVHDCSHSEDAGVTCQGMYFIFVTTCMPNIQHMHINVFGRVQLGNFFYSVLNVP